VRKAVLDTSVLVSAFLVPKGPARELLGRAEAGEFVACLAEEILAEAGRVLAYPRIRGKYRFEDQDAADYLLLLRAVARVIGPLPRLKAVARDPNDDMVVACAVKAKAAHVVTRDKDLLDLKAYRRIKVVSPEDYLALLRDAG
jgi:uncharacterized protein